MVNAQQVNDDDDAARRYREYADAMRAVHSARPPPPPPSMSSTTTTTTTTTTATPATTNNANRAVYGYGPGSNNNTGGPYTRRVPPPRLPMVARPPMASLIPPQHAPAVGPNERSQPRRVPWSLQSTGTSGDANSNTNAPQQSPPSPTVIDSAAPPPYRRRLSRRLAITEDPEDSFEQFWSSPTSASVSS